MSDPSTSDSQDMAEMLDSDKIGGPDDTDLEPDYPPERPMGVDQYGTSPAEEQIPEPLDQRVLRETTDPLREELGEGGSRGGAGAELDAMELQLDPETQDVLDAIEPVDLRPDSDGTSGDEVGRLVEPDEEGLAWTDTEATAIARPVEQDDLSAEESAVHTTDQLGA